MIWFIVLNTLMNDGTLYTEVQFPLSPEFNNEQSCNEAGQSLVDQRQVEIGTKSGKTYFICQFVSPDQIKTATQKPGQDI
jgi:hypothetical protein